MTIFNLSIDQGSTFEQVFTMNEDLTGYTVSSDAIDSTGVITSDIATIATYPTGVINVVLSHTQTALMSTGVGHYDIELTDTSSGRVTKPIRGRVTVTGEVTK